MKKNLILFALISLPLGAFAASPISGQWILQGQSCLSGAAMTVDPHFQFKLDAAFSLSDLTMVGNMHLSGSMDKVFGAEQIAINESARKTLEQLPDSPEKKKQLAQIQSNEKTLNKMIQGMDCEVLATSNYTVQGNQLTTTLVSKNSTCSDDTPQNTGEINVFEFRINGANSFSLINSVASSAASKPGCPPGDRIVSTFVRQ